MAAGLSYDVTYTIDSISGGQINVRFEGTVPLNFTSRSAAGTYSESGRRDATHTTVRFVATGGTVNASIDNLIIRPYMQAPVTLTSSWQRFNLGVDTTTANRPNPAVSIYLATSGDAIDIDFVQGEGGPFVSSLISPTGASAITRAEGTVSIPIFNLGTKYNYRQGTIIVDWSSQPGAFVSVADADFFGILSLGDLTADNVMGVLINHAHNAVVFRRTVATVSQSSATVDITAPLAGQSICVAFSWNIDLGNMQVAARGAAGVKLTGQTSLPPITHMMPGRFSTTRPLFGNISGVDILPTSTFDSALAALT
jgi:hypothetical protein